MATVTSVVAQPAVAAWPLRRDASACVDAPENRSLDRSIAAGVEAFNLGQIASANKRLRRARRQAWLVDDPVASGRTAYNLAAIAASDGRPYEAIDLLIDARSDLARGGCSTLDAWLLQSRIEVGLNQPGEAARSVAKARRQCSPCCDQCGRVCGVRPCDRRSCLQRLPGIGKRIEDKRRDEDCQSMVAARIQLATARVAVMTGDIAAAIKAVRCASSSVAGLCDYSLLADVEDVAALIDQQTGLDCAAVGHLDRQVVLLRLAEQSREIPKVLMHAAEIDVRLGHFAAAASRANRAARVYLSRDEPEKAWQILQRATPWIQWSSCRSIAIRMTITARAIEAELRRHRRVDGLVDQDEMLTR